MALHSLYCAEVPLRNCSLTHSLTDVTETLGCRQHIEWYRKSTGLVNVRHPQLSPGKLPLHVAVSLSTTTRSINNIPERHVDRMRPIARVCYSSELTRILQKAFGQPHEAVEMSNKSVSLSELIT